MVDREHKRHEQACLLWADVPARAATVSLAPWYEPVGVQCAAGRGVLLTQCLPSMHNALVLFLVLHKTGVVVHTCDPSTGKERRISRSSLATLQD